MATGFASDTLVMESGREPAERYREQEAAVLRRSHTTLSSVAAFPESVFAQSAWDGAYAAWLRVLSVHRMLSVFLQPVSKRTVVIVAITRATMKAPLTVGGFQESVGSVDCGSRSADTARDIEYTASWPKSLARHGHDSRSKSKLTHSE
jgi:hypothetical protein